MKRFFVGVDLGQRRDHTAIAVVERVERRRVGESPEVAYLLVRHAERVPLGTPYPLVVERVREILGNEELIGDCTLVVDATGVGGPVVETMRRAGYGCEILAVTITAGERESQRGWDWSVPKKDLMAGVQMALEREELKIARKLKEAGTLVRELCEMRATQARAGGGMRFGAEGAGQHDDLAIALALAVWQGRKRARTIGWGPVRLPGI